MCVVLQGRATAYTKVMQGSGTISFSAPASLKVVQRKMKTQVKQAYLNLVTSCSGVEHAC